MNQIAQAWILKGYEHFAKVGPINFSVKKVSEENKISRTTFNYHFKSQDEFFDQLYSIHLDYNKSIIEQAKQHIKQYNPDLYTVLYQYPIQLQFQLQLFNHRFYPEIDKKYMSCIKLYTDNFFIRSFTDHYNLEVSLADAQDIHEVFFDVWYSRLNICGIALKPMIDNANNIVNSMFSFARIKQSVNQLIKQ